MKYLLFVLCLPLILLFAWAGSHLKYKYRKLVEDVFPKWGRRINIGFPLVVLIVLLLLKLFEVI